MSIPRQLTQENIGRGDTAKIIGEALKAWGITLADLRMQLCVSENLVADFDTKNLSVTSWLHICRVLCLQVDAIQNGYTRQAHLAETRWCMREGDTRFPKNPTMRSFLAEIKNWDCENRRYTLKHYSLRLRWRLRFQEWRDIFRSKLREVLAFLTMQAP